MCIAFQQSTNNDIFPLSSTTFLHFLDGIQYQDRPLGSEVIIFGLYGTQAYERCLMIIVCFAHVSICSVISLLQPSAFIGVVGQLKCDATWAFLPYRELRSALGLHHTQVVFVLHCATPAFFHDTPKQSHFPG